MNLAEPLLICSDIRVQSLERSIRFYRMLGLKVHHRTRMVDGTRVTWMKDPSTGQLVELFQLSSRSPLYRPFRRESSTHHALIFSVTDVRPLLDRLLRFGGRKAREFVEGEVRFVFLRDPDGTWIELLSWADSRKAREKRPPLARLTTRPRRRSP